MRDDNPIEEWKMFQPDVLLPTQFFAAMRKRVPQEAEYRLILAVLEDAIECYQKHVFTDDSKARVLFEETESWLSSDDREWPYSFVNICEILNLNPGYLRGGLQQWQDHQVGGTPRMVVVTGPQEAVSESEDEPEVAAEAS